MAYQYTSLSGGFSYWAKFNGGESEPVGKVDSVLSSGGSRGGVRGVQMHPKSVHILETVP